MRRILPTLALLFAWFCANGAMLDAMQVAAWARMFAGYSETLTITQALEETFDPAKPCEMCRSVAKVKETRQSQLPPPDQRDAGKFVLAVHTPEATTFEAPPCDWSASSARYFPQRTERVPVPPPRA